MKLNLSITINQASQLHIEASSLTELDEVRKYLSGQGISTGLPADDVPAKRTDAADPAPAAASSGAKGAAAGKPAPKGKPAATAAPAKTAAGPAIEDVTAVLSAVADKFGVPEAFAMNQRFGVKKAGELAPTQYADYIEFAKNCLATGTAPTTSHVEEDAAAEDDVSSLV